MTKKGMKKIIKGAQLLLGVVLVIDLFLNIKSMMHSQTLPLPVVTVSKPRLESVVEYITQTGNTVAFNSVNLVARVEGFLDKISFEDGSIIKKDTPLFVIEPEPYWAKVQEAQASLDAARATDAYNKAEYARQKRMYKENATSLNSVEKWLAKSQESTAGIESNVANLEIAKINYSYTLIKSPFNGRIGRHMVDVGNLVGNGAATILATIEQLDPIYVYFNLNEIDLLKLREADFSGKVKYNIKDIPVSVSLQNEKGYQFEGKLDFVNTSLDASTGTMELRAILPNKKFELLPNFFVQVRVPLSKPKMQLTVPDAAVLYDQIGAYVLLVNKSNIVVLQRVGLGGVEKGRRAIEKGLQAQDEIITSGLQNATPGNPVSPLREKPTS